MKSKCSFLKIRKLRATYLLSRREIISIRLFCSSLIDNDENPQMNFRAKYYYSKNSYCCLISIVESYSGLPNPLISGADFF